MTTFVLCKTLVPWLCSRSQPGIKVIIRGLRGHLLHSVTFLVYVKFKYPCYYGKSVDPDQMPHSSESDLGPHRLQLLVATASNKREHLKVQYDNPQS